MRVTVTRQVTHLCPYKAERDLGTLTASWDLEKVELHGLSEFIEAFSERQITHEDFTWRVRDFIASTGGKEVEVVTTWQTAGMAVEVRA